MVCTQILHLHAEILKFKIPVVAIYMCAFSLSPLGLEVVYDLWNCVHNYRTSVKIISFIQLP